MSLEPKFADVVPYRYMPAPAGYFQSADCIREDIASREEDIASWQATVDSNRQEIPRLQVEMLQRQLDIAQARLEIHELRAKLAAKTTLHEQLRASVAKEGGVA